MPRTAGRRSMIVSQRAFSLLIQRSARSKRIKPYSTRPVARDRSRSCGGGDPACRSALAEISRTKKKGEMRINIAKIRQFLRRITCTPYARSLETELSRVVSENSRLREENRALLNSILGIAGIPPVYSTSAEQPRSLLSPRAGSDVPASGSVSPPVAHARAADAPQMEQLVKSRRNTPESAPLRRRSWHQINRTLEIKSARKSPQERPQE
jgi:hypothetical protein